MTKITDRVLKIRSLYHLIAASLMIICLFFAPSALWGGDKPLTSQVQKFNTHAHQWYNVQKNVVNYLNTLKTQKPKLTSPVNRMQAEIHHMDLALRKIEMLLKTKYPDVDKIVGLSEAAKNHHINAEGLLDQLNELSGREEFPTMFESWDQKADQLFALLSIVLKKLREARSSVVRNIE